MRSVLHNDVQYVKGVGPRRATLFGRLDVRTVEDLLYYFPRDYQDRRHFTPIAALEEGEFAVIKGEVLATGLSKTKKGKKVFRLIVDDGSGRLPCLWFNQAYLDNVIKQGEEYVFTGKVQRYQTLQMANPEFERLKEGGEELSQAGRIVPLYPLTEGLNQKALRTIIKQALDQYLPSVPELLPDDLRARWQVIPLDEAIRTIHYPADREALKAARKRLILDEFFILQLALGLKRERRASQAESLPHSPVTPLRDRYIAELPFNLTGAQRRVIREIKEDMTTARAMNRLLQGDVGSGKTVVAVCALLTTVDNGYQGAIMAPTEILAAQHYENIQRELAPLGLKTVLLTGGVKGAERKRILREIEEGTIQIVAGTHALIQKKVAFKQLGMIVIDEQHKFGVRQRSELRKKGFQPHVLVMTATPIPRTLTLTVYGDLDVSILDEMPPGREKVKTYWIGPERLNRAYAFIREQAAQGGQAFIIYPLVEESEVLEVKAATEMFEHLKRRIFPGLSLGLVHGRMTAGEKQRAMDDFRRKKTMILVSTVVVEIGIDMPDATVMLIENAERFGLAQLHQLRGRVGRSRRQAYCILQGNPRTEDARRRLQVIKSIDDGFLIAREDLEIRGPGEFFGTQQTGLPELRMGNIIADIRLMEFARRQAFKLLERDPALKDPELSTIRRRLMERYGDRFELGDVG
ncbi:MAG: ATP-dependent DNA helicase RecG [Candidatus Euphemobacter frigidus]|nr:ATP-dependent DNA helicase RecG [Candidatus Euphemobacter frigidus]MDP8275111.1 ATP-dependent DNA helicase RecG [Candidatus Euphemobacter frigidus]